MRIISIPARTNSLFTLLIPYPPSIVFDSYHNLQIIEISSDHYLWAAGIYGLIFRFGRVQPYRVR